MSLGRRAVLALVALSAGIAIARVVPWAALARLGRAPIERIAFVGDSITEGVVRVDRKSGPEHDALGGYPGRLSAAVGEDVALINLGIGGATTYLWLMDARAPYGVRRRSTWTLLRETQPTLDLPERPDDAAETLFDAALAFARPQVVVLFLGTNDIALARSLGYGDPASAEFADALVDRLAALRARGERQGAIVLVCDVIPDHRSDDATRAAINARIAARFPDRIAVAHVFETTGLDRLLADSVHPNASGYALLAETIAGELRRRGLIADR